LHRDISAGNLMFARSGPFVGFIQDLDYDELVLREGGQKIEPEIERSLKDIMVDTFPLQFLKPHSWSTINRALSSSWRSKSSAATAISGMK
jgi:hypothetical protein